MFRNIALFLGGVAVGAISTYLLTRSKQRALEEDIDSLLEEINIQDESQAKERILSKAEAAKAKTPEEQAKLDDMYDRLRENREQDDKPIPAYFVDGKPVYKDDKETRMDEDDIYDEEYEEPVMDGDYDPNTPIHPISQAEWFELDKDWFDPVTWDYYEGDGIVLDELGDIVPVPLECLGLDAFEWFGKFPEDDKNLVYIVNPQLKMVFELVKHAGSYVEEAYGIDLEEDDDDKTPKKFRTYDD